MKGCDRWAKWQEKTGKQRKLYKQGKRGLTFVKGSGILTKLSARWALRRAPKIGNEKKGLTKTAKCGNLIKLLLQARRSQLKLLRRKHLTKSLKCGKLKKLLLSETDREFKNFWKKFLTNEMKFAIIAMFRRIRRVPCKLNNVTKRKHQTEAVLMNRSQKLRSLG